MLLPTVLLDCPGCGEVFEHVFNDPSAETMDEVHDAPVERVTCPECSHEWTMEYPGWTHTNEA